MRQQKIGDWWFLRITQTERNANLTVVIISLGVQCIQLPPIVFRWSVFSRHYLIASTHVDMILEFSLVRRAACILWIFHHVLQGNTLYSELISGFLHEKLWDPGGVCYGVWDCQWQVVRVNSKGRLGAVHPTKRRFPLEARIKTWLSSCEVLPIRRHGKSLLYVQPFLAMGFFRTHLEIMWYCCSQVFSGIRALS
jgi:hypothetical protein